MKDKHYEQQSKDEKVYEQIKQDKLSEEEKKSLQVKDGQNNHDVDEVGGF
ncbi:hypothetical protein [Paenisporosarcina sp. TG20]|nr:hypothetical protein [Paenisporosarcina sp. TG20]